ncbi:HAMP domain-containing sensor histidine kinase [Myroides guanonis]|uniref:histidine kinase n=1 Tax=Myroides guanonis TaxID=1150112 RepID=A0A1I3UQJ0_9FLAO|nr:ATP-binding protein [Myroides guanonis]SFJ84989.1 PAS/PAC sensor signal transduction histidine kinase [Myroides guanonis]
MKIKTKLTFGVGLLFLMIIALATISGWYVNELKKDTNNILVANYNTIQYSRSMLLALEDIELDNEALDIFQKYLDKQQLNMTEIGEVEATNLILKHFERLKTAGLKDTKLVSSIRKDITELMRLNMEAIERKSHIADDTAQHAIVIISFAGTLCFLVAFVLLINLPSNIANPIEELTRSIKEIAGQNYKKRVHFESHNEFGGLAKSFNTMAEKLEEYSESKLDKILKGKKRIETLIDSMHDAVIGIDETNKILFINDEALKITGLDRQQILGRQIQDIAVTNDLIRDIVRKTIESNSDKELEEPMKIYANGKESYFERESIDINIVPTGEESSQFIGQVIMLRNITPFKELDMAKTNFIGTVSHEFKTPIASIKMGVQLLENKQVGILNEEQEELINGIKDDVDRLLRITGELISITQLESGTVKVVKTKVPIFSIVDYAINANKVIAEQKKIRLQVLVQEGLGTVLADSEKTAWVLTNLVSNAVRYSYENSVVNIEVSLRENQVKFSVKDVGEGIQDEYLEKIFERYFRIPGTKKEGTGLGLSISKDYIEAQGGTIWVESDYGAGSTFCFTLDLGRGD